MLGVWQVEGDSSLNLTKSLVLACSSTEHCSPEKPEAEACVFATGCFSVKETSFGISEASGVRTSLYYKNLTNQCIYVFVTHSHLHHPQPLV